MICYLYIQPIAMFLKISIKSYTCMCACVHSHQKKSLEGNILKQHQMC